MQTTLGTPTASAIVFFFVIVGLTPPLSATRPAIPRKEAALM